MLSRHRFAELRSSFIFFVSLLGAALSSEGVKPLVLVPGITSSVLEANLHNKTPYRDCRSNSPDWYTLWVSEAQLGARLHCFIDTMTLHSTNASGCTSDQKGVSIRAVDWGGTKGVSIVNPRDPIRIHVFKEIFDMLESLGLESNVTLRTATYDWRRFGDPCFTNSYFRSLQALVQETSARNSDVPVKLACHSMGCQILHIFLSKIVTAAWKATYVEDVLALAPTFAGTSKVVEQWITGPSYPILPLSIENLGRRASGTWPALLALFPRNLAGVPAVWEDDMVFISTPQGNYTFASLRHLVSEVASQVDTNSFGARQLAAIDALYEGATEPGVNLTCVYIVDVKTDFTFAYKDNNWSSSDSQPRNTVQVAGDRANPRFSAEVPCKAWGGHLVPLALQGVNHVNMLQNRDIIALVRQFALGLPVGTEKTSREGETQIIV